MTDLRAESLDRTLPGPSKRRQAKNTPRIERLDPAHPVERLEKQVDSWIGRNSRSRDMGPSTVMEAHTPND